MSEMTMVERVARALAFSAGAQICGPEQSVATREFGWKHDGGHLDLYNEAHWKEHVHAAGFAIEAMREPTSEMWDAGAASLYGHPRYKAKEWAKEEEFESDGIKAEDAWRAMIDAALA
jgi:hypothetical protein